MTFDLSTPLMRLILVICGDRMFTSRSEYRMTLRSDNADMRLTEIGTPRGPRSDAFYDLVVC
jgi:hypothetical protein